MPVCKNAKGLKNITEIMFSQIFWRLIFGKTLAAIWRSRIYFGGYLAVSTFSAAWGLSEFQTSIANAERFC